MSEIRLLTLQEVLSLPDPEWLVDGLIIDRGLFMLAANPKVGKSLFTLDLALHVARGAPFLGRATRKRPVVIVAAEDGAGRVGGRLRKIFNVPLDATEPIRVGSSASGLRGLLEQFTRDRVPKLIILDPLIAFLSEFGLKDENSAPEVERAMQELRQHCAATGSAIVLVHHFAKTSKDGGKGTPRGSSALTGAVDGWIDMSRSPDGVRCVPTLRDEFCDAFELLPPDPDNGHGFRLVGGGDAGTTNVSGSNPVKLTERVVAALANGSTSSAGIAKQLAVDIKKIRTATRALEQAKRIRREFRKGTIEPNPKGKWELIGAPQQPPAPVTFASVDGSSPKRDDPTGSILAAPPLREVSRVPREAQNDEGDGYVRIIGEDDALPDDHVFIIGEHDDDEYLNDDQRFD